MELLINELETKWGKLIPFESGLYHCDLPFISGHAKLNVFFSPIQTFNYQNLFERTFHIAPPAELLEFYSLYNGCRLFSDSLSIWGLQDGSDLTMVPFDIRIENNHALGKLSAKKRAVLSPYVFFGSLGGEYLFATCHNDKKIYVIKKGDTKVVSEFESFNSFWRHYVRGLIEEYDQFGKKIHVNKALKAFPSIANTTVTNF